MYWKVICMQQSTNLEEENGMLFYISEERTSFNGYNSN